MNKTRRRFIVTILLVVSIILSTIYLLFVKFIDYKLPTPHVKKTYCIVDSVTIQQSQSSLEYEPIYIVHTSCNSQIKFSRKIQWVKGDTITIVKKL